MNADIVTKKPFPEFKTDEEAEYFVETSDLSEYDFSVFKPFSFEFEPKSKSGTMRLPEALLSAVKRIVTNPQFALGGDPARVRAGIT
jgi:predicted DNA binding CopG/RHH family protein